MPDKGRKNDFPQSRNTSMSQDVIGKECFQVLKVTRSQYDIRIYKLLGTLHEHHKAHTILL